MKAPFGRKIRRRLLAAAVLMLTLALSQLFGAAGAVRLSVPFLRQEKNGCGPASIAMIQSYWSAERSGIAPSSLSDLHQSLPVTRDDGTLLIDMRRYLESKGYHAFTIQASSADLIEQISKGRALIVALSPKAGPGADLHYVVVTGIDEHRVWLNDPAKRTPGSVDRAKFEESWNRAGAWMLLAVPLEPK